MNGIVVYYFRSHKLWRAKHHLEVFSGVKLSRQTKVNDFDPVAVAGDTEDVLWLEVEVEDVLTVHVVNPITDLTHEVDTFPLCQDVIIIYYSLKQFTAENTVKNSKGLIDLIYTCNILIIFNLM